MQQGRGGNVSQNPLDYYSYVLYVLPGDANCIKALEMVGQFPDVLTENVASIPPEQRPPWLDGVPTLVSVKKGLAFKGTFALTELQKHTSIPSGAPARGNAFTLGPSASSVLGDSRMGPITPMLTNDSRYQASGRAKDFDIQAYLERRERTAVATAGGGVPPPVSATSDADALGALPLTM